jgi:hypothetical protein
MNKVYRKLVKNERTHQKLEQIVYNGPRSFKGYQNQFLSLLVAKKFCRKCGIPVCDYIEPEANHLECFDAIIEQKKIDDILEIY